jgi:hypothetical protein
VLVCCLKVRFVLKGIVLTGRLLVIRRVLIIRYQEKL